MPLSRKEVVEAHRLFLGSEPSVDRVASLVQLADREALRRGLMSMPDFMDAAPRLIDHAYGDAPDFDRRVIVFLHLPKCAGTSLHAALLKAETGDFCPERHNGLGNWPSGKLARYSYFSGHFDITSLGLIPARQLSVVTLLRKPQDRLLSAYRFLRSHLPEAVFRQRENMGLVQLARDHDAVSFFRHPATARHASINNAMTRALTGPLPTKRWEAWSPDYLAPFTLADDDPAQAVADAMRTLLGMTAFGVRERMEASVRHIFSALDLAAPKAIPARMVYDRIVEKNDLLEGVPAVELTEKLSAAIAPHVTLDNQLYASALDHLSLKDAFKKNA